MGAIQYTTVQQNSMWYSGRYFLHYNVHFAVSSKMCSLQWAVKWCRMLLSAWPGCHLAAVTMNMEYGCSRVRSCGVHYTLYFFTFTRRYSPLCGLPSSSCLGLRPRICMLFFCVCLAVSSVTISNNLINFEKIQNFKQQI